MASLQGRGSLTESVPDYRDPDVEIRNLLQSPNYRDRRRGKLLMEQRGHELARNQQREEFYFRQRALEHQLRESQQSRSDINRENEAGRMERARQHNELVRVSQEDNRTRNLISAMNAASYDQSPEGKALLRSLQTEYSRIIGLPTGTAPAGAPAAAGGGKGEYGPGGAPAPTGGKGEYGPGGAPAAPATTMATNNQYNQPTGDFTQAPPNVSPIGAVDQGLGFAPNGYPILPNTPEPRYVPLGANPLDYSTAVPGGMRTPSGGFIGGELAQRRVAARTNVLNPPPNEAMAAAPVGEGYTPLTAAFTQPASAPAQTPQPVPAAAPTPGKIQISLGNAPPVDVATVGYTGGTSNAAQDAAQREELRRRGIQPPPYRF